MKRLFAIIVVGTAATLTGCLKDKAPLDPEGSNNVIEIFNEIPSNISSPTDAPFALYTEAFEVMPSAEYELKVSYSGAADGAPNDIQVTLEVDPEALNDYNDYLDPLHPTYTLLPSNLYSVDTWTVTIPSGQKRATINVEFFTDQFDLSEAYALPVKIASVSSGTISSYYGTVIFAVLAKNKYDGRYKAKGYGYMGTTNTTAPYLFSIDCDWGLELATTGANSVGMNAQPVFRNGSIIYFGGVFPNIVFDPNTDEVVDVDEGAPGNGYNYNFPDPNATTPYPSRYDPATKTIYVRYNLISAPWYIIDTLEYCGPR